MFFERFCKENTEDSAADKFADSHGESKKRKAPFRAVGIAENQRHNDHVGDNGRNRGKTDTFIAEGIGPQSTDKGGNASENNVPDDSSRKNVGNKAANEKAGNRRRGENRKYGEHFRKAELDDAA